MTNEAWLREINKRLKADPRFAHGMRYHAVERQDGKVVGAEWYDPSLDDRNQDLFLRISNDMCRDHPLIEG